MPEIRIDPLSGYRAIVAADAGGAGNGALRTLLAPDAPAPAAGANPELFWAGAARGAHERIEIVPGRTARLAELSAAQVVDAVQRWRERMRAQASAACLHLTLDEPGAGGSFAELYALDFVPAAIARERERFGAYAARTMGGNLLGDLVQHEVRLRDRIVAIDSEAVLMAPYGSRAPYQLLLAPRTPRLRFEDDGPTGAALLHDGLCRLARALGGSPPLSLWVRTAPSGAEQFCWRIDVLPRLTAPAGFELGTGVGLDAISPERAAAALRDA
ncbi:MAG: hypothetical protein ACRDMX_11560 [Solirubrobacteraceae bacterium]